jgi:hypothetical protein
MEQVEEVKLVVKLSIENIVKAFNRELIEWQKEYGSQANFRWRYTDDGYKTLECIDASIKVISYKEDPTTIEEVVEKLSESAAEAVAVEQI